MNEPFFLAAGVVSAALGLWVAEKIKLFDDLPKVGWRFVAYFPWLGKEIYNSSIDVLKQIWAKQPAIQPDFVEVQSKQKTAFGLALLGNSITLTPGTVTVQIEEESGKILVHALTQAGREGLLTGEMDTKTLEALK